jgi:cell division protein FtsW (lipid II flippase)
MDRPRFQVDIGTMLIAVAIAAIVFFLWSLNPAVLIACSLPLVSCVVASHTFARCRFDGRKPNRTDWGKAAADAIWIAAPIKLLAIITIWR